MKLEEIQSLWEQDAIIDYTDLTKESLKIPQLHSKYYSIFLAEKKVLNLAHRKYKELKHNKTEFIINPNQEDATTNDWKAPSRTVLKNEIPTYLEGDKEMLDLELQIGAQQEKVDFLKSIIQSFTNRGFLIKNAIEDRKFMNGE